MVRFRQNALVIEIPCTDGNVVEYYEGLQNALYDVFWNATAKGVSEPNNGANWIAAYLGPALAQLEPAAREVLQEMAWNESDPPYSHMTDEQILSHLRQLDVGRFEQILKQLNLR